VKIALVLIGAASVVQLILALVGVESWLFYIYYFSYTKLGITLTKYIPQAWLNFRRKSTVGWSIGNILLDLTGGLLSFLQQFIDAINSGNWGVMIGSPVKFVLGLISIAFDVLFIIQHYGLYPEKDTKGAGPNNQGSATPSTPNYQKLKEDDIDSTDIEQTPQTNKED
jgi:cystinosin